MAVKQIPTTHELAAKLWADGLEAETLLKISVHGLVTSKSDSVIQKRDMLSSNPGDVERVGLRMQDATAPKTSGQTIEGSEKTLTLKYLDITINEFAEAYRWDNVMSRIRVTFEHRDEAKAALSDLLANAWDTSFFNQIAGMVAAGAEPTFEGNNTINAPTAENHIFAGSAANEGAIAVTDVMTLDLISRAKALSKTGLTGVPIRKARIPGFPEPLYVVFVHPWQNDAMRQADTRWDNICNSAMQGGMIGDNPLITGAMGIWDECLIVENSRVPQGAAGTGTATRRAILCGAQAAISAQGRIGGTPDSFRWVEKLFEYDREMGVMGGFVAGIKKSVFTDENAGGNPIDFATLVMSTATDAVDV